MSQSAIFKIYGMHCVSCAMNIDGALEDAPGVIRASANFAKTQVKVEFEPKALDLKKIVQIIEKAGYRAEVIAS